MPIRDIAQIGGKNRFAPTAQSADREFDQDLRAVRADTGNFQPFPQNRSFACLEIMLESLAMSIAQRGRNDQASQLLAERLVAAVAKNAFGSAIKL